jgi:hypothetical protein
MTDAPDHDGFYAPKQWSHAKDFEDSESGLCIRVNYTETESRFPGGLPLRIFSWELVRTKYNSDKISRYFPIMIQVKNGRAVAERTPIDILNNLIHQAEYWAEEQRQARENLIVDARIEREKKEMNRVVQPQRPGLKQLGRIDRERNRGE